VEIAALHQANELRHLPTISLHHRFANRWPACENEMHKALSLA
jgi:hypothetical protein